MILKSRSSPAPCHLSSFEAISKFRSVALNPASVAFPPCVALSRATYLPCAFHWPGFLFARVTDPNGHALIEGAGRPATPGCTMCAARLLPPLRHLDEAKHGSQDTRVLTRIFVWVVL